MDRKPDLSCDAAFHEEGVIVRMSGKLEQSTAHILAEAMESIRVRRPQRLAFDLENLWSYDSVGLGKLFQETKRTKEQGCAIAVLNAPGGMERAMRQIAMDRGVAFIDEIEDFIRQDE